VAHHHGHAHHGHAHGPSTGRALWISLALTLLLGAVQIGGAVAFDSLALVSDAIHNLSDAVAVGLAVGAASGFGIGYGADWLRGKGLLSEEFDGWVALAAVLVIYGVT